MDDGDRVRVVAMICLTSMAIVAIVVIGFVAVLTDRDLTRVEVLTFLVAVSVGLIGGLSLLGLRRRHRWRLERDDLNGEH